MLHQLRQGEHLGAAEFVDLAGRAGVVQRGHQGACHVLHRHRLKAGVGTCQRHQGKHFLQFGEQIDESIVFAKNDAGSQHRQIQALRAGQRLQRTLALGLAALVHRGALQIGAQRADMHQPPHTGRQAGLGHRGGQGDMQLLEARFIAVQHSHQVDHRVVACDQLAQAVGIVHIGTDHGDEGQHLHRSRRQPAGGHGHLNAAAIERLTQVTSDETGPTQNQNFFHGATLARSGIPLVAQVIFDFLELRLQLRANAQGHAGGQNVDDQQVQQA